MSAEDKLDQQARAALLKLYGLLRAENYDDAAALLSQRTRDFLVKETWAATPAAALAQGSFRIDEETSVLFNPLKFLLGGDIGRLDNSLENVHELKTPTQRDLFVTDPENQQHRVRMIIEEGRWVRDASSTLPDWNLLVPPPEID